MRIPQATYRIQLNPRFGFKETQGMIPYLEAFGISDVYASPIFRARKGSLHGYDIVDPNRINPELGTESDFKALSEKLKSHGMGWLQDIVPNHMAFHHENYMLMDVLENGLSSEYVHFFDIDWDPPYEGIKGRLLAPFLGSFYGESLEQQELRLQYGANGFGIDYYGRLMPLKVESYARLLTYQLDKLRKKLGADHPDFINFLGVLYVLKTLPSGEKTEGRYEETKFIKTTLWELYRKNQAVRGFIDETVRLFNGQKGNPESFNLLNDLLSDQVFRLSFWKVATEEINYRRFFSINDLISLRIEDPEVLKHAHALIFKLTEEERFSGLRIDHIDGLYDPTQYLKSVRERVGPDIYIVVEKILGPEEDLPPVWPVQGTTGYDFLNYVNGILCSADNEERFDRIYSGITGLRTPYESLVADKKRLIMGRHMAGDIDNLAHLLKAASSTDRHGSDITIYGLRRALVEVMAQFPIYRTYVNQPGPSNIDRSHIEVAVERAVGSNPGLAKELRFIQRFLLLESGDYLSEEQKGQQMRFVMRFQQFTSPLMAKGFEDTTLYVYNRLLSLNEVGGDPSRFGMPLEEFHRFNQNRASLWPHSLNATATHDTKRGEDVRARINVLSEIPKDWEKNVKAWIRLNRKTKKKASGMTVPDSNDEYFLYQTLIGAFPFGKAEHSEFVQRMKAYIRKAVREAKVHTAWLKPDTEYENAFGSFLEEILRPGGENPFLRAFCPFQKKVSHFGMFNSLAQTLIKITAPGVPDFYQGTEVWDLSLVDPDNRRPVDYEKRRALLMDIQRKADRDISGLLKELLRTRRDGRIKLFLIHRSLMARRENPELFEAGAYVPLGATGPFGSHVVAFARIREGKWVITLVPRFTTALVEDGQDPLGPMVWRDTSVQLPEDTPHRWRNALTDDVISTADTLMMAEALKSFPVALLLSEGKT